METLKFEIKKNNKRDNYLFKYVLGVSFLFHSFHPALHTFRWACDEIRHGKFGNKKGLNF
jgi:hypothetical protein